MCALRRGQSPSTQCHFCRPHSGPVKMQSMWTAFWHSSCFLSFQYCLGFKSAQILIFIYELKQWHLQKEDSHPYRNSHLL